MKERFRRVTEREVALRGIREIIATGDVGCTGLSEESRGVFEAILRNRADLYLVVGDLAHTGSTEELDAFISLCDSNATAPVYATCGNHDLPDYAVCCGRASYCLVLEKTVFVFLDNADARFKDDDLNLLREALEKHRDKKFVVLFHIPPPLDFQGSCMRKPEWDRLRAVLEAHRERIECIVSAHIHGYYDYSLDGYRIFVTAGGGGTMLYDMPKEEHKFFHALLFSIAHDGSVKPSVIPVTPPRHHAGAPHKDKD